MPAAFAVMKNSLFLLLFQFPCVAIPTWYQLSGNASVFDYCVKQDWVVPYMVLHPDEPNLNGYASIRNAANR